MPTENQITQPKVIVKRYHFKGAAGEYVYVADFDRVTAERDALWQRLNAADQRIDELTQSQQEERQTLIAYGRSCGLDEASTLCSRMAYETYYPAGSRFKLFTPKAQQRLGDLLIKAANAIATLPDGPFDRFQARQQMKARTSAAARQEHICTPARYNSLPLQSQPL
ncbi:hypothetical protein HK44_008025 [Pseudomonas fluorescens HK44]|uniref:Uncharacterized protein n=1 Tax=Pseudomonas fluorescens HK44 TaxID=1042209 RepID=A0A010RNR0_PSEFL|nr:hypothetical protein [Pseudomonas fluorescens]EXF94136.1 hypothetical protein HK44_008025 [Pseudomonas fluorescens HK44]